MDRVGLAVGRFQPLHFGHCRIIDHMIRSCKVCILAIGSSQKSREKHDPWTFEERKAMVKNVYGDRLKIIQLTDLGTTLGTSDWVDYVLGKIEKVGLPTPTDYWTGSIADSMWYRTRFGDGLSRALHIVDRDLASIPAATDLRTFLELNSDDWKQWVPEVNWEIVEENFPREFRIGGAS
jgi:bifunctional NMN adenylyltransferase/nudix hydrolase